MYVCPDHKERRIAQIPVSEGGRELLLQSSQTIQKHKACCSVYSPIHYSIDTPPKSSKGEVMKAMNQLRSNPYTGAAV